MWKMPFASDLQAVDVDTKVRKERVTQTEPGLGLHQCPKRADGKKSILELSDRFKSSATLVHDVSDTAPPTNVNITGCRWITETLNQDDVFHIYVVRVPSLLILVPLACRVKI